MIETLYTVCGAFWTVAYIFIIRRGLRDKTCGMPFVALSFNISFEILFSTILNDGNPIHQVTNGVWALLDIFILYTYFKYGKRNWPRQVSFKYFYPYSIFVLLAAASLIYFAKQELHDDIGAYTAYLQNLMMSILFINMIIQRGNLSGQSVGIALTMMLGTFFSTVMFALCHWKYIAYIGGFIFAFDFIYLLLVLNQGRLVWPFRLKLRS